MSVCVRVGLVLLTLVVLGLVAAQPFVSAPYAITIGVVLALIGLAGLYAARRVR